MSFIRPEVARAIGRWREVLAALAVALAGLWLAGLGGPAMLVLGGIVTLAALALAVLAWRRARFRLEVDAPGVVKVDEGRIFYMGPVTGGAVDLSELVELSVLDVAGGRRCWMLRQADGHTLLVPLAAAGAETLYDQFAVLPGIENAALMSALDGEATQARRIWRRSGPVQELLTD